MLTLKTKLKVDTAVGQLSYKNVLIISFLSTIMCFSGIGNAQVAIDLNAWGSGELSKGQENSHYYYNEIHPSYKEWRIGVSEVNLLSKITIDTAFSINLRGSLVRSYGRDLEKFILPQVNLQFAPQGKKWSIALGRFIVPFGGFAALQHPKQRIFINYPLAFSYYNNISPFVGYAQELGEIDFFINGRKAWGSTMLYFDAYTNGARFDLKSTSEKLQWSLALTNSTPNMLLDNPFDFTNWAIISKLKLQPTYFWQHGISVSYGTFGEAADNINFVGDKMKQLLLGTDFILGYGFWEVRGEVIGARYQTPEYLPAETYFEPDQKAFSSISLGLSLKYEFPILSGLYAAYGIEYLAFNEVDGRTWDDDVTRHNFAAGYKITNFLLLRANYMLQTVENHPFWEQNTFRTSLTIYY